MIRRLDPAIPTFCDWGEALKIQLYFMLGLLPYVKINCDSMPAPYPTRDLIKMKLRERNDAAGFLNRQFFIGYIFMVILLNKGSNALLSHLNKRGILTSFWVINDDDEIKKIMRTSTVSGIMTDRPENTRRLLADYHR